MKKNSSIKKTLPRMTKFMIFILILLILPINIGIQSYMQHKNQRENSKETFGQMKQIIEINARDLKAGKEEFSKQCILSADMVAYFVEHYPSIISDLEKTRELAKKINVDEIHYFTKEGKIYAGSHPEYYNLSFHSGKQMSFFLPMLSDKSLKLCQEITPNTAEQKEMQYAAVWLKDGSGIVQIGMEPRRLLQEIKDKSIENIFNDLPLHMRGYLHIIDRNTSTIVASTAKNLIGLDVKKYMAADKNAGKNFFHYNWKGKKFCVYTENYKNYILVRTYVSLPLIQYTAISTVLVFLYIVLSAVFIIKLIIWYVDKKLAKNLEFIINDLRKIKEGNLENIVLETGITEYDELIFYINQLQKSIRLNWGKLSNIIDKGHLPIGIFEYNSFYKKTFINDRLFEILGIEDFENIPDEELTNIIKEKIILIKACPANEKEKIYKYNKNRRVVYLRMEKAVDEESVTYYITDVSTWWEEIYSLKEKSSQDILTGLFNRRGFNDMLGEIFSAPEKINYGVMIMVDADGLKKINDIYGHHAGDKYLCRISEIIKNSLGENSVCARLGGDEFAAFVYSCNSLEEIHDLISVLKSKRGEIFINTKTEIKTVEFSIGYAVYPMDGTNYHLLMNFADENMYQEKRNRKLIKSKKKK